jgi:hypothetical protein
LTSRSVNVEEIDDIPVIDLGRTPGVSPFPEADLDLGIALHLAPFGGWFSWASPCF